MFSFPALSDDIYRFLWDGHLIHKGVNPLSYLPSELIQGPLADDYLRSLFPLLNSPEYYTIYPPISQLIYYCATFSEHLTLLQSTFIIKCFIISAELGTIYLLYKLLRVFKYDPSRLLIYALNPLIIIELCSNLHFEAIMVFTLLAAILFLVQRKGIWAGMAFSVSVATKLLPLMFLPALFIWLLERKRVVGFFLSFALFTILFFTPFFLSLDVNNFLSSLDLYFQKFEFNASTYYVVRYLGKIITGYNQISIIGPLLSLIAMGLILKRSISVSALKMKGLIEVFLMSFLTYLFFTTTVHPWYLSIPIAFSVFYKNYWILVWSLMITLSYCTYANPEFKENMWLVGIEYLVVFLVWFYERKKASKQLK